MKLEGYFDEIFEEFQLLLLISEKYKKIINKLQESSYTCIFYFFIHLSFTELMMVEADLFFF